MVCVYLRNVKDSVEVVPMFSREAAIDSKSHLNYSEQLEGLSECQASFNEG